MLGAILHHWPAEVWVAICTGVLAGATFLLALFTWRAARASGAELAVSVRPIIVDAPEGVFVVERTSSFPSVTGGPQTSYPDQAQSKFQVNRGVIEIEFAIRNGGLGPALISPPRLLGAHGLARAERFSSQLRVSHTLLPLGEVGRVSVRFVDSDWDAEAHDQLPPEERIQLDTEYDESAIKLSLLDVEIPYTDMTGRQRASSRFELSRDEAHRLFTVDRVELRARRRLRRDLVLAELTR